MAAWLLILLCVGIAFVFILLVLFLLGMRYLNYRENIKMAEQGLISQPKPKRNRGFLIAGWIITGLGLVGTVILWLLGALALGEGRYYPLALGPWVLIGLVPMAIGLFLLLLYVILAPAKNKQPKEQTEPSVVEFPEEEIAEID
ncbi:MAG: hypothetical protein CL609_18080 [Anaerolineaceae bacterium]|nr:hypothetical protein [Anaerolineaceae bacterium]